MSRPKPIYPDEILIEICNLWFREKMGPSMIREKINAKTDYKINREEVYSLLKESRDRGFIRISPPEHNDLSWELMAKYNGSIKVVSTGDVAASKGLAAKAAELVIDRIKDLDMKAKSKDSNEGPQDGKIHIGIGAGHTTRSVVSQLATLYNADSSLPDLEIHALTSGFKSELAHLSPISWFSWFMKGSRDRVSFVGLFAPPMVPDIDMYNEIKKLPGIAEAYKKAKDIQIVVTSLANAVDPEEHWFPYIAEAEQMEKLKKEHGLIGDVLYCPYSDNGPIPEDALDLEAVTIFNIPQLVDMAKISNHMIILICGPGYSAEHKRKTQALRPLLENEDLRVWTHLVTDVETASELLYG